MIKKWIKVVQKKYTYTYIYIYKKYFQVLIIDQR